MWPKKVAQILRATAGDEQEQQKPFLTMRVILSDLLFRFLRCLPNFNLARNHHFLFQYDHFFARIWTLVYVRQAASSFSRDDDMLAGNKPGRHQYVTRTFNDETSPLRKSATYTYKTMSVDESYCPISRLKCNTFFSMICECYKKLLTNSQLSLKEHSTTENVAEAVAVSETARHAQKTTFCSLCSISLQTKHSRYFFWVLCCT